MNFEVLHSADREEVLASISSHPFEFGFRKPIIDGIAKISPEFGGNQWHIHFDPPSITDRVWYGNCVQDALTSAEAMRENGLQDVRVSRTHIPKLLCSPIGHQHFVALCGGEIVDHSNFFSKYMPPDIDLVALDISEENILRERHTPVSGMLQGKAYTEFPINSGYGLSEVSLWVGDDHIKIGFDITIPERSEGSDYRIFLPIPFGSVDRYHLNELAENEQYYMTTGRPGMEGFTEDRMMIARKTFPNEITPLLKQWIREMIDSLPDNIPDPF